MTRSRDVSAVQNNLGGVTPPFAAGKNKIINGDFGIWQRGTSFSNPTNGTYTADRFYVNRDGSGTVTCSQQTFTPGTAPVSGYEGNFFFRWNQTVAGTGGTYNQFVQKIEDVRTFAGQTVTVSFWAKADTTRNFTSLDFRQDFGSGGSSVVGVPITFADAQMTTSWKRFTGTATLPSISGKTIGTGSSLGLFIGLPINTTMTIDIWGVQVEAGSTATPFQTATGTIQGELAACQRYYYRQNAQGTYNFFGQGSAYSTTGSAENVILPITMRITPTSVDYSTLCLVDGVNPAISVSTATISSADSGLNNCRINIAATGLTQYRYYGLAANNSTSAYLGFSAEL